MKRIKGSGVERVNCFQITYLCPRKKLMRMYGNIKSFNTHEGIIHDVRLPVKDITRYTKR
jgi:hypothetical protein